MESIALVCLTCGKPFERHLKEHVRNQKKGRKIFCSLTCSAIERNKKYPGGNPANLRTGSDTDELSSFRWYLKVSKQRKQWDNNLTLEFLCDLWKLQKGKCPYTKLPMRLPRSTGESCDGLDYASLDRIDSTKGYVQGNVEFVTVFINYAKNKFSRNQVQDFLGKLR